MNGDKAKTKDGGNDIPVEGEIPTYALPKFFVQLLNDKPASVKNAVPSDSDYFNALLAVETCRALISYLEESNRGHYFGMVTNALSQRKDLAESMEGLLKKLESKLLAARNRMEESDRKPLVERFLDALKASPEEKKIFRFVLCINMMPAHLFGGQDKSHPGAINKMFVFGSDGVARNSTFPSGMAMSILAAPATIAQILDVPLPHIMQLMSPDSIFVKEGLYYNNSRAHSSLGICIDYGTSPMTKSVLQGLGITLTQYDGLKSTALQKVLLGHPPFRDSDVGEKVLRRNAANDGSSLSKNVEMHANALANALKEGHGSNGEGASKKTGKRDRLFDALASTVKAEEEQAKRPKKAGQLKVEEGIESAAVAEKLGAETVGDLSEEPKDESTDDGFGPYVSDLAYLEDQVRANLLKKKVVKLRTRLNVDEDDVITEEAGDLDYMRGMRGLPGRKMDENAEFQKTKELEKVQARLSLIQKKIDAKIRSSASENGKVFRLEQLCQALHLGAFEKSCILLLLEEMIVPARSRSEMHYHSPQNIVGNMINLFCTSLEEKMKARRFFYKTSTMIEEGILTIFNDDFTIDLNACTVKLDRRLFDFLVGLDTEMSELVNGSHLYKPDISIDDVILPDSTKKRALDCVLNFDKVKDIIHESGMAEKISYGLGQVLLFSNTWHISCPWLPELISKWVGETGKNIAKIFSRAKSKNAILVFDEAEGLFGSRKSNGGSTSRHDNLNVGLLLQRIEEFSGICVVITNMKDEIDDAFFRRFRFALEFKMPSVEERERIWKSILPEQCPVAKDVDFGELARRYEMSAGGVKNALLRAATSAALRADGKNALTMGDLRVACEAEVGKLGSKSASMGMYS